MLIVLYTFIDCFRCFDVCGVYLLVLACFCCVFRLIGSCLFCFVCWCYVFLFGGFADLIMSPLDLV